MQSSALQAVSKSIILLAFALVSLSTTELPAQGAAQSQSATSVNTIVHIEGLPDASLNNGVRDVGETTDPTAFSPRSFSAVRRAARRDAAVFTDYLQSQGYYAATVSFEVSSTAEPYVVTFNISLGKKFVITDVTLVYVDKQRQSRPTSLEALNIQRTDNAHVDAVEKIKADIRSYFRSNGYPRAQILRDRLLANFGERSAVLEVTLQTGPRAVFGDTQWIGLKRLKQDFADTLIPWREDELFDLEQLALARQALSETNLFSSIEIAPGETDLQTGRTPAIVTVTERWPRTIGVGGSYSTNKGPGIRIFWENRNIINRSEKLRVDLSIAQIEQELTTSITKPLPRRRASWTSALNVGREDSDAFEEERAGVSTLYAKRLTTKLSGRIGAGIEGSRLKEDGVTDNIILVSFPTQLARDTVDSALDPTKGTRLAIQATPFAGRADGFSGFGLVELSGVFHQPLTSSRRVIVSGWSRLGATLAGSEGTVPSNKRYYAGGGGSIRGYGYQLAGPVDAEGDPEGGNAVVEFGVEMRGKVYKDVALAAFFEGGSAFESRYPDFSEKLLYGAGAGVRYHTAIGPIRVDFAVPLDRRRGIDDAFQFYISLGQAF